MAGKVVDVTLRMIDQVTSPLNSIGSKLKDSANQWTKAGKQIQSAGKSIASVGKTLTASVTAPIVAAGAACVTLASDFESGMSKVQSISGATSDELELLSDKAKEMGAKTKYSATEATDAFSYMAMAGWKTQDMLDGIEGVMYLAGATGEDLASTSDIVTDALTAFGMGASDTNEFVDVLAATASNANTDVSMLGESFKYCAPIAGAMGYSVEDVSTALGLMANSGIKASSAGTALRSWMSNMAAPTDTVQSAMDALGLSLTDSEGNMKSLSTVMQETKGAFANLTESEKSMYAKALAGKTGMSGLLAVVNSSDSDFDALTEAIENSNGACQEMYETANNNLEGQITILKSSVESLAISFGELLLPYVSKGVKVVQDIVTKFNSLTDAQKENIVKIAAMAAAVGPALLVFGKMVGKIGKVVSVVGKVGKAFKVFGSIAGLITSPAGIVIAVLGALVVAGVLVYKNWDKIKAAAGKLWSYVKKVFSGIGGSGEEMKEKISAIGDKFQTIGGKLQELWIVVQPVMTKIGELVKLVFEAHLGAAVGAAIGYFKSVFASATEIIGGVMTVFEGLIDFITGVFTGNWSKAWDGVKEIFGGAFEALTALAKAPLNAVIGLINGAIAGINNLGLTIPDWVPVLGGKTFSIDIPTIPTLAAGTDAWKGGIVQISERGGEIVDLPSGSRVYPHDESVAKAYTDGSRSASSTFRIEKLADQIVVREDADIDKIAQKLVDKIEKTSLNMGGGDIGYQY